MNNERDSNKSFMLDACEFLARHFYTIALAHHPRANYLEGLLLYYSISLYALNVPKHSTITNTHLYSHDDSQQAAMKIFLNARWIPLPSLPMEAAVVSIMHCNTVLSLLMQ